MKNLEYEMKNLLRLEELAQLLLCVVALIFYDVPWWVYPLLFLGPDIGMLGYLVSPRVGAVCYNLLHHKGIAAMILLFALVQSNLLYLPLPPALDHFTWLTAGLILFGHASMDRAVGYGLKFGDNFHHTHLGWIGAKRKGE